MKSLADTSGIVSGRVLVADEAAFVSQLMAINAVDLDMSCFLPSSACPPMRQGFAISATTRFPFDFPCFTTFWSGESNSCND